LRGARGVRIIADFTQIHDEPTKKPTGPLRKTDGLILAVNFLEYL